MMNRRLSMHVGLFAAGWLALALLGAVSAADAPPGVKQYWDKDYSFGFQYPAGWKLRPFPEGEANRDLRVIAEAPDGGSLMVVIEKLEKTIDRADFDARSGKTAAVEKMARQTIEEIYRTISKNIRATGMKVGEVRDVSSRAAIKYYIATLHEMPNGRPIIVAGIHALPFGKPHRVDFIMTTPWNSAAKDQNEAMMMAFNSFYLLGENGPTGLAGPGQRAPGCTESNERC
jgi:hypothetical protein